MAMFTSHLMLAFTPLLPGILPTTTVIVPGGRCSGQTIYVSFLDEKSKPKTVAAKIPPNSYPGMQFFVEVPQSSRKIDQKESASLPLRDSNNKQS